MLTELKIENVAVIEKSEITFGSGLNILTGETGAGKSIVIDAINMISGERTSKELVRDRADSAKVTALFDNISENAKAVLDELEIETEEDGCVVITRTLTADGRSSCRVNGQPVTVSMLRRIGNELITICGQHDSQRLLQKDSHLEYIDALSGLSGEIEEYREVYRKYTKTKKELSCFEKNEAQKQQKLDYLIYRINELEGANIVVGEREKLLSQKKRLQNREKIASALYSASVIINGDENTDGLMQGLHSLSSFLAQLAEDYHSDYKECCQSVENFRYELDDCLSMLSQNLSSLDEEEIDIDSIEERLDLLYRLSRKYGETEQEMLETLDELTEEYNELNKSEQRADDLKQELALLEKELTESAFSISEKRKAYAKQFENSVMQELSYLDMPGALFEVAFEQTAAGENGIDCVEFLISANSGQQPKPLTKIASGGELSRIMLAIRCVLSQTEGAATVIFDEIDTGVSGKAAHKIAFKLRQISREKQTICVTHLAQIAAGADNHFLIEKIMRDAKTYTSVSHLVDDDRIREIARIIGGDVITKTTLMSACELIDFANTP